MQLGIRPSAEGMNPEDIPLPLSPPMPPSGLFSSEDVNDDDFDLSSADDDDDNDTQSEISDIPADEPLPPTPYPHIFVVGDAADAFGAIKAGHTAYWQAEVAARNILRLAKHESCSCMIPGRERELLVLERYEPGPPGIKVSLGIVSVASFFFCLFFCLSSSFIYVNGMLTPRGFWETGQQGVIPDQRRRRPERPRGPRRFGRGVDLAVIWLADVSQ